MGVSDRAAAVALAGLPSMNPNRLRAIEESLGFQRGWAHVLERRLAQHPRLAECLGRDPARTTIEMARAAAQTDPESLLRRHRRAGVEVLLCHDDPYPADLAADPEPPSVLFACGDLDIAYNRRVAVIGTRRCTRVGRGVAVELGEGLARAGVAIVSGLALGIDGAAHEGALRASDPDPAPVVGVVGSGLDIVYPRRHRELWEAVATRGLLLSEWPLGTNSQPWRFPARNRIIAALAEVVVVVESHASGGALHTADAAIRRGREVLVVPGSVKSPASDGTNGLLFDGAGPARDSADVLGALGFAVATPELSQPELSANHYSAVGATTERSGAGRPSVPMPGPDDLELLDQLAGAPRTIDQLAMGTGRDLTDLSVALLRFEHLGWVARSGSWFERIGP